MPESTSPLPPWRALSCRTAGDTPPGRAGSDAGITFEQDRHTELTRLFFQFVNYLHRLGRQVAEEPLPLSPVRRDDQVSRVPASSPTHPLYALIRVGVEDCGQFCRLKRDHGQERSFPARGRCRGRRRAPASVSRGQEVPEAIPAPPFLPPSHAADGARFR